MAGCPPAGNKRVQNIALPARRIRDQAQIECAGKQAIINRHRRCLANGELCGHVRILCPAGADHSRRYINAVIGPCCRARPRPHIGQQRPVTTSYVSDHRCAAGPLPCGPILADGGKQGGKACRLGLLRVPEDPLRGRPVPAKASGIGAVDTRINRKGQG